MQAKWIKLDLIQTKELEWLFVTRHCRKIYKFYGMLSKYGVVIPIRKLKQSVLYKQGVIEDLLLLGIYRRSK